MEELLTSVTTEFRLQMPRSSERKCKGYAFIEGGLLFFGLKMVERIDPFGGCLEGLFSDGGMGVGVLGCMAPRVCQVRLATGSMVVSENLSTSLSRLNLPVIMVQWKIGSNTSLVSFVKGHFPRSAGLEEEGYLVQSINKFNMIICIFLY